MAYPSVYQTHPRTSNYLAFCLGASIGILCIYEVPAANLEIELIKIAKQGNY
jgi:hypothetical protein